MTDTSTLSHHLRDGVTRKILETMNDGLFVVAPGGRIVMVNEALCALTGFEPSELVGKPCTVLKCDVCAKSRAEGRGNWCRLFDTGLDNRKQCRLVRKDGSIVEVLKNAAVLSENGEVLGAVETVTDVSELTRCERTIQDLRRQLENGHSWQGMIGGAAIMRRTFALIEKAAQSEAPVIIFGESGTGKELVARAIHELSPRSQGPLVQCSCAALSEGLLESELFGHAKGAFTGAYRHRVGRFEAAHGGSLFLDEIGDIPPAVQVKLLRVLETKRFERVGDHTPIEADVRIISATNRDLDRMVAQGEFREDLFFRIKVIPIHLPPLRERREDIPLLVDTFLERLRASTGRPIRGLTPEAMQRFMEHPWPGNVRELKSALEYAFVVAEGGLVAPDHLPLALLGRDTPRPDAPGPAMDNSLVVQPGDPREKRELVQVLRQAHGNKSEAARILGVNRTTVHNRMRKYGVSVTPVLKA